MRGECLLCGRYTDLERHHIFGGSNRKKSERYGLVAYLCHDCHNEPPFGAHHNKDTMQLLHARGQALAMQENGWSVPDFIREFGKNYLEE